MSKIVERGSHLSCISSFDASAFDFAWISRKTGFENWFLVKALEKTVRLSIEPSGFFAIHGIEASVLIHEIRAIFDLLMISEFQRFKELFSLAGFVCSAELEPLGDRKLERS